MAGYGAGFPPVKHNKIPAGYYGQAKFDAAGALESTSKSAPARCGAYYGRDGP